MNGRKKVIFAACSLPAFVDMAVLLRDRWNWDPVYWIGRSGVVDGLNAEFPEAVFHEHGDAMWARPPKATEALELPPIDEPLLVELAECESIVLRMMDRMDYAGALDYAARRRLYHTHVRYWSGLLDYFQPDLLYNVSTPHQIYDFVLQELCRLRGIPTLMFGMGFDLNRLFCKTDYRQGAGRIPELFAERVADGHTESMDLPPDIEERLAKVTRSYDQAIPALVSNQLKDDVRPPSALSLGGLAKAGTQTLRYGLRIVTAALSKEPARWKTVEASHKLLTEWLYREMVGPLRLSKIRDYYNSLAAPVDPDIAPYVYLPLSYQPELSSSPEGGAFVEQRLMVSLISRALPPGWKLYVKEHPVQFTYSLGTNRAARSIEFYDALLAHDNVQLVPLKTNPFALIDRAKAVATVTGTSGWESLVRGKPVMYFGYPWWQGCHGAFYVRDLHTCRKVLAEIEAGFSVEPDLIRLFAKVTDEESCRGDLYWNRELHAFRPQQNEDVARAVEAMADILGGFELSLREGSR
jgi:hypothetical protein